MTLVNILVVDDNIDAADTLALLLRNEGHSVHTAYGGKDAIGSGPFSRAAQKAPFCAQKAPYPFARKGS